MYRIERPNLRNKNMSIKTYFPLENPLQKKLETVRNEKQQITQETMNELKDMEKKYKQNYVECTFKS
jgi:hypothetical protein